jgi:hypothetical protein
VRVFVVKIIINTQEGVTVQCRRIKRVLMGIAARTVCCLPVFMCVQHKKEPNLAHIKR